MKGRKKQRGKSAAGGRDRSCQIPWNRPRYVYVVYVATRSRGSNSPANAARSIPEIRRRTPPRERNARARHRLIPASILRRVLTYEPRDTGSLLTMENRPFTRHIWRAEQRYVRLVMADSPITPRFSLPFRARLLTIRRFPPITVANKRSTERLLTE